MKRALLFCAALLVSAASVAKDVQFTWTNPLGATGNKFYCGKTTRTYDQSVVVTPAGNTFTLSLPGGVTGDRFFCAVTATNAAGESGFSNEVTVDVAAETPPGAPVDLKVVVNVTYDPVRNTIEAVISKVEVLKVH